MLCFFVMCIYFLSLLIKLFFHTFLFSFISCVVFVVWPLLFVQWLVNIYTCQHYTPYVHLLALSFYIPVFIVYIAVWILLLFICTIPASKINLTVTELKQGDNNCLNKTQMCYNLVKMSDKVTLALMLDMKQIYECYCVFNKNIVSVHLLLKLNDKAEYCLCD